MTKKCFRDGGPACKYPETKWECCYQGDPSNASTGSVGDSTSPTTSYDGSSREPQMTTQPEGVVSSVTYDPSEQDEIIGAFSRMLRDATSDGGRKRAAGIKPSWKVDPDHESAIFSHLMKWKRGEVVDKDSGAHPLVHAAWRCLAIAYQETAGAHTFGGCACD